MKNKLSWFLYFNLILGLTTTFAANVEPELAKQTITEILAEPTFKTTREEYRWQYIGESSSKYEPQTIEYNLLNFTHFIARLVELLLWILLGAGIIFLIIYISKRLNRLPQLSKSSKSDSILNPKPQLLNQDFKDNFPMDIPKTAWESWQSGERVAAISLLYRGAISVLVTRDGLNINDSATESECLRKVKSNQPIEISKYFSKLIRNWQQLAYAGRLPNDIEAQELCQEWQRYFG